MIITLNWLKEFLDTNSSLEQICDALVKIGLEVESVEDLSEKYKPFIIAEVTHAEQHPNADSLRKCKVFDGTNELDIVCGAVNARAGIKVVLAPVGAVIPANGMVIKESAIRGEKSQGMLCSNSELMLGVDAEKSIIELPLEAKVGTKFAEFKGLNDVVIDISITPNRADCLGVYGIARDLAAFGIGKLKKLPEFTIKEEFDSSINVAIKAEGTKYFAGRYVKNTTNIASPDWMQNYLNLTGHKPKSLFVDVTNYINLSFARPMHAYDADKLNGNLTADFASDNEKFKALNGNEYTLKNNMVVIKDNSESHAIAGVIGGEKSASTDNTTNVFLESAYFDPSTVINSGRSLAINSDSRYRFERGVDMKMVDFGLDYAAHLIQKYSGGIISKKVSAGSNQFADVVINVTAQDLLNRTGIVLADNEIEKILNNLGFVKKPHGYLVPSYRLDVTIKEDLIEEIARIHGYENIPVVALPSLDKVQDAALNARQKMLSTIKTIAASRGLMEVVTWSFMYDEIHKEYFTNEPARLLNPISSELGAMRQSVIPNLLRIIKNNESRMLTDMVIFEQGPVFGALGTPGDQANVLAIAKAGMRDSNHYKGTEKYSALDVKTDVFAILSYAKLENSVRIDREVPSYYHPAKSGRMTIGKDVVGYFGEVHPKFTKLHSIKQNVAIAELFLDKLPEVKSKSGFKGELKISDFQPVMRRFSFIITKDILANNLLNEIKKLDKNLIKEVKIFDYTKDLPILNEGEIILGISIVIQSDKETLDSSKIDELYNKVVETAKNMGAKFREM